MSDQHPKPSCNQIIDMLPDPFVVIDKNYRIVAANRAYRETFGDGEPILGRHCYEVSHHYSLPCCEAGESCPVAHCRATGEACRMMHLHYTCHGEEHEEVTAHPLFEEEGEYRWFLERIHPLKTASAEPNTSPT